VTDRFSPGWCEAVTAALADLPVGPGGSGVVQLVVTGGDPDRVLLTWVVEDGRPVSVSVDSGAEPQVVVPVSWPIAEQLVTGEIDPAVAYMRGDLKPEGSSAAWFAFLSALARDDTRSAVDA
jgi:hypothetical protein